MRFNYIGKSQCPMTYSSFHKHLTWELIYNVKGSGTMEIGGKEYPFSQGSILLCPPDARHCKQSREPFEDYYITFYDIELPRKVYCFEDMHNSEIYHVIQVLYSAYYQDFPRQVIDNLFQALMGMVNSRQLDRNENKYVRMLRQIIVSEFTDPEFNLKTACAQIPQNIDHLRRNFKEALGITPHQYLTRLRMESAKHILTESPDLRVCISDVAYFCGFSDPLYFSKVFRKETGRSPSDWHGD